MTFTGPIMKGRIAVTQSFEYRYVRTPVNSLPPLQRDTKLESFDSYTIRFQHHAEANSYGVVYYIRRSSISSA